MPKLSITEIQEQLAIARLKKFNHDNLQELFQKFYQKCVRYFENCDKLNRFESKRIFLFLKEMNALADRLDNPQDLPFYEFYQHQCTINALKPGIPEHICNYGIKFTIIAFFTLCTSLLVGALAVAFLPVSLPLIISALVVGAAIGALMGILEANDKVDRWCHRFFRPRDSEPIPSADAFLKEVDDILNPKMKLEHIHNPNGVDLEDNCFANCLPF
ncbi:hypothetical protein Lsan_1829 [Legionella santicrucis]|uniref:Uncharacterized protein n=1 Tax=Legionella santicrucis TaxID=45074 RepID=A0A0W0YX43_9GAMM|nr:hypothetical protein [Legionella santicrucis]KTD61493.1 hypothetical protein Lsan_1829 [Legionella santicrucis]